MYYNGTWGTVCDDSWSRTDASVVCRMLGYSGAVLVHGSAHFGQGTGSIWLDEVGCSGRENSLFDCYHRPWGDHDCSHFEDAGVVCGGEHVWILLCDAFLDVSHYVQILYVCNALFLTYFLEVENLFYQAVNEN